MAAKKVSLLLNKTVENLGIVGDVVKVRPGFARNFLLPLQIAEAPTPTRIEKLKAARAAALAELEQLRAAREQLLERMHAVVVTLTRSCNDQGILYGSVSQRDIADGLQAAGYDVGLRSVRLAQTIRRVGEYHVPIQFDKDLKTDITLKVEADRTLDEAKDEIEIDEEGEMVEKKGDRKARKPGPPEGEAPAADEKPAAAEAKAETGGEPKAPKAPRATKKDKPAKA